jgi:hypothetical protein
MNFQKTIIVIAIIILIIGLIFVGVSLKTNKENNVWPPIVGDCPDYWIDLSGNGSACFNRQSLGKCNLPRGNIKNTKDFNTSTFTGQNGKCAKYTWAKRCGVIWDGITSGITNPCTNL